MPQEQLPEGVRSNLVALVRATWVSQMSAVSFNSIQYHNVINNQLISMTDFIIGRYSAHYTS